MIAYIYNRVSSDDQSIEGTSLESQSARNEAHAQALGFANVRQFNEVHTAAQLWERPVLNEIREDIRARKVGALVCYAIDRLTRDVAHLMILQDECERHGCALHFTTETLDSTPEGKLMASVRGYVAEVERLKIIERTVRGRKQRLQAGRINLDSYDLYGYRRDKEKGVRLIVEAEAAIVRNIFENVRDGDALNAIARRLNATTPSPFTSKGVKQGSWTIGTLRLIIGNEAYKGETYAWRHRKEGKQGRVLRPREEWIELPKGVTPPIVTPELWQAANEAMAANVGDKTRNASQPRLLRGLIYCSECGEKRYPYLRRKKHHYVCGKLIRFYHGKMGVDKCISVSTPADKVEAAVWKAVISALNTDNTSRVMLNHRKKKAEPLNGEAKAAQKVIAQLEAAEARLLKRLREVDDDLAELILKELRDSQSELQAARQKLADIEIRQSAHRQSSLQPEQLAELIMLASQASSDDFAARRQVLERLKIKVFVNGETWEVQGL